MLIFKDFTSKQWEILFVNNLFYLATYFVPSNDNIVLIIVNFKLKSLQLFFFNSFTRLKVFLLGCNRFYYFTNFNFRPNLDTIVYYNPIGALVAYHRIIKIPWELVGHEP